MIGYFLALIPLYLFLYRPLSLLLLGPSQPSSSSSPIFNSSFLVPPPSSDSLITCPPHNYTTHILSISPLVLYVPSFLSSSELSFLLSDPTTNFSTSAVSHGDQTAIEPSVRDSLIALPARTDTIRCIEQRALAAQGWRPNVQLERLKLQRYGVGGHYAHHYDWTGAAAYGAQGWDRWASWMVFVSDDCRGGGTAFPRLKHPGRGGEWCARGWVECPGYTRDDGVETEYKGGEKRIQEELIVGDEENQHQEMGMVFRPVAGNAVFWVNLREDGTGFEETWHAGLPVEDGVKVGLNIWSWGRY